MNKILIVLCLLLLLFTLYACDSIKALNIKGDGTSVEKELRQEVISTQRDYQHKSLEQNQNTNIK
ncbi:hypothetical protein HYU06_02960 [Candidatus Woesearchaeota archaeon]|nr:hypothetical protein [Candidatus Woesearchaeota archaeon]